MRARVRRAGGLFVVLLVLLVSCATPPPEPESISGESAESAPPPDAPAEPSSDRVTDGEAVGEPESEPVDEASAIGATGMGADSPRPLAGAVAGGAAAATGGEGLSVPLVEQTVERRLSLMSLRERIGQRFISFVPGTRLRDGAYEIIQSVRPAGFIVYPWNFEDQNEARVLINTLQFVTNAYSPGLSLLIAADQEGGRVRAFRFPEMVTLPSAATLGALEDPELIAAASYLNARQLRSLGVNMNFAPVLDLFSGAEESIIGDRSFGDDPHLVSRYVEPYLAASRRAGVIATVKHFPGHGVTTVDSHLELPVVRMSSSELAEGALVPFVTAIEQDVPAIMTAHLVFADIDPHYPVTISRVFMHEMLREQLGYQGVVVSDGLEMGAMSDNFDLETTLVRLFRYDVDLILLYTSYDVIEVVDTVERLVSQGRITPEAIDRGVRRVLRLKYEYGLLVPELQ